MTGSEILNQIDSEDLPTKVSPKIPVCTHHGQRTCYDCLHSYNCNADGSLDKEHMIESSGTKSVQPSWGKQALFIPQVDTHLALAAGIGSSSENAKTFQVEDEIDFNGIDVVGPPPLAPRDDWFHYCPNCQLTWMQGLEGRQSAAHHPSHRAFRDKRTLVCWVGVLPPLRPPKSKKNAASGYDTKKAAQGEKLPTVYQAFSYFGEDSFYNHSMSGATATHVLLETVRVTLRVAAGRLLDARYKQVKEAARTNSEAFIEKAQIFRLVVVISDPDLVEFLTAIHACLWWRPEAKTYRTTDGKKMRCAHNLGEYEVLRQIEVEIERLAEMGIAVKWYHVHPSLNKAMAIVPDVQHASSGIYDIIRRALEIKEQVKITPKIRKTDIRQTVPMKRKRNDSEQVLALNMANAFGKMHTGVLQGWLMESLLRL
ncbi:hypothetical protein KJ359_000489 [Pestalotiopsis sp. 9143b]|nr:hypothetical protein KJ359_000489 [Pestalotiopsis sp. 9143b]